MKIYLFNNEESWEDVNGAVAIISNSKEEAENLYRENYKKQHYEMSEYEIVHGLAIVGYGYDESHVEIDHLMEHS